MGSFHRLLGACVALNNEYRIDRAVSLSDSLNSAAGSFVLIMTRWPLKTHE